MANYGSLDEFMIGLEKYSDSADPWSEYLNRFVRLDPAARAHEMSCYDSLLENEHRPTKQLGEFISKRRQMADVDALCKRGGR